MPHRYDTNASPTAPSGTVVSNYSGLTAFGRAHGWRDHLEARFNGVGYTEEIPPHPSFAPSREAYGLHAWATFVGEEPESDEDNKDARPPLSAISLVGAAVSQTGVARQASRGVSAAVSAALSAALAKPPPFSAEERLALLYTAVRNGLSLIPLGAAFDAAVKAIDGGPLEPAAEFGLYAEAQNLIDEVVTAANDRLKEIVDGGGLAAWHETRAAPQSSDCDVEQVEPVAWTPALPFRSRPSALADNQPQSTTAAGSLAPEVARARASATPLGAPAPHRRLLAHLAQTARSLAFGVYFRIPPCCVVRFIADQWQARPSYLLRGLSAREYVPCGVFHQASPRVSGASAARVGGGPRPGVTTAKTAKTSKGDAKKGARCRLGGEAGFVSALMTVWLVLLLAFAAAWVVDPTLPAKSEGVKARLHLSDPSRAPERAMKDLFDSVLDPALDYEDTLLPAAGHAPAFPATGREGGER